MRRLQNHKYIICVIISFLTISIWANYYHTEIKEAINIGFLIFTALMLLLYTYETQKMKEEIVVQTKAIISPSIYVEYRGAGNQHDELNFTLYNYSIENIAIYFKCQLFFNNKLVKNSPERSFPIVGHYDIVGDQAPYNISFQITKDQYKKAKYFELKYSYYDKTESTKYFRCFRFDKWLTRQKADSKII